MPRNAAYLEVHDAICPDEWTEASRAAAQRQIDAWIEGHGRQAWMQAIMMGQYDEPSGLNYGGRAPEWSHRTLDSVIRRHLPAVQRLAFIDWHTGLGPPGQPFFLCFNDHRDANWERAAAGGAERIESADGFGGAARPRYSGLIFYGVQRLVAPAEMAGAVIEFGTLPVDEAFDQLRIDRAEVRSPAGRCGPAGGAAPRCARCLHTTRRRVAARRRVPRPRDPAAGPGRSGGLVAACSTLLRRMRWPFDSTTSSTPDGISTR